MPDNEIERLTVTLEANYADFLKQIDKAVQEAAAKLKEVDDAPKKSKTTFEELGGYLGGKFLSIITSIGAAMAVAFSVNSIVNFFSALAKGAVDANAQFETFTVQFQTLLGSVEAAQGRIKELAEFGLSTPFELPDIVEADRLLQTFGGTALATGENLRRIGDSAAAVNANFKEVSFWTGRMFSAMQAGRPFGEASARLQELGILTGDVRTKLEDMQKAGASGTEMWAAYSEMIDTRFAGAMDRLSKTFQGVMSNLADFQGLLLREGGADLFEGIREDAVELFEFLDDNRESLVTLAEAFGSIAEELRDAITSPLLEQLQDVDPEQIENLADSVTNIGQALGKLADVPTTTGVGDFIDAMSGAAESAASVLELVNILKELTFQVSGIEALNRVGIDFFKIFSPLQIVDVAENLDVINQSIKDLTGSSLSEWLGGEGEAAETASDFLYQYSGSIEEAGEKTAEATDEFIKAREALDGVTAGFQDLQAATSEKLQELEADHGEKITEIDKDFADKQAEIAKDRDDALLKLEKDTAEKRQEIQESTQDALAKLAKDTMDRRYEVTEKTTEQLEKLWADTNETVAKLNEEHHKKEKRQTEDHQRDMQKLQEDYLFDLQDAVTARDARAIVDLRRRFQKEKAEKEKDFKTDQRRDDQDLSDRVKDVRETEEKRRKEILKAHAKQIDDLIKSEADKREEILASQEEQLSDLAKNEAKKRQEIEASYQEQMAKAEAAHAEQIARENERYEERRQKLVEAMAQRLEDEAKALADQKDITEEGAQAILEALNKTFGIGGDIDAMMEDFRNRRRQKMTIQIKFDQEVSGHEGPGEGTGQGQGSHPGAIPGFQFGGIVPGPRGQPRMILAHGGEEIVPVNEVARLNMMRQGMGGGGGEMRVKLDISGSAPPGIRGGEVEQIAGVLVRALKESGINARR